MKIQKEISLLLLPQTRIQPVLNTTVMILSWSSEPLLQSLSF